MSDLVPVAMTEAEAQKLTERIRITAQNFVDARDKLQVLVADAKAGNAHLALGYASWTAYLADVLGDEPMRLARADRQELVQILSNEGMSTRAIAPIVGAHPDTVASDIKAASVGNPTDSPRTVESLDGITRTFQPKPERNVWIEPDDEPDDEPVPDAVPKRKPLPEQYFNTVFDLGRNVKRLTALTEDDRFPKNRDEFAHRYLADLTRHQDAINTIINQLKKD